MHLLPLLFPLYFLGAMFYDSMHFGLSTDRHAQAALSKDKDFVAIFLLKYNF